MPCTNTEHQVMLLLKFVAMTTSNNYPDGWSLMLLCQL